MVNQTGTALYGYKETADSEEGHAFNGLNQDAGIAATESGTGFDANDNLQKDGTRVMTYDVFNRLVSVTGTGVSLSLTYDPIGRLSSYSSNGTVTQFLYDGTNLIGEYDGTGAILRRYLHTLGVDQPFVEFTGSGFGNPKYLLDNSQGSIIAMADGSGTVSASDVYKYGAFGEPRNGTNQESWTGSRFRYTGQTTIPEARLYYYKARVYDPVMGRFLQTDPIGSQDDLDLYAYVGGDPVNGSDPTGTDAWGDTGAYLKGVAKGFVRELNNANRGAAQLEGGPLGYIAVKEADWIDSKISAPSSRWEAVGDRGGRLAAVTAEIVTPAGVESTLGRGALGTAETVGLTNVSKNSLAYVGDTHVYAIIAPDETIYKIGESAQGTVDGVSRRASAQVRKLIKETGDFYDSRILKEFPGKAEARRYETRLIERFRKMFGDDKLPGNKTNR